MKRCRSCKVLICCLLGAELIAAFFLSAGVLPKPAGTASKLLSAALIWLLFGILVPTVHPCFQCLPRLLGYGLLACVCTSLPALLYDPPPWPGILQVLAGVIAMALGWLIWSRFFPKDEAFTQDMSLDG